MSGLPREQLAALLRKEWRQARRHRGVWISGAIAPVLVLIVVAVPVIFLDSIIPRSAAPALNLRVLRLMTSGDPLLEWVVPVLVTLAGLLVPPVNAVNTILSERERRTNALIASLPFDDRAVLLAKVLVVLGVALAQTVPLVLVDGATAVALGVGDVAYASSLALLAIAATFCGTGVAVAVAVVSDDARTATNLVGLLSAAILVSSAVLLVAVERPAKVAVVAAGLVLAALFALAVGLRRQMIERYLS